MNAEQAMEQGDYQAALGILGHETSGATADPAKLLMRFSAEVRLQQFPSAMQTMQRLIAAAPELAAPMNAFAAAAQAEASVAQRQRDPGVAGRRAAFGPPPPYAMLLVQAAVCHAQGDATGARAAIQQATNATPPISGTITRHGGSTQRFTAFTDSDELTGATLLAYDGPNPLDLPLSELTSISFAQPKTSFDVMWPMAEIVTVTGMMLRVRVPAYYSGTGLADDAGLRTGRETSWNRDRGYAVAAGQRDWSITLEGGGMSMVGILGVQRIDFNNPRRAAAPGNGFSPQANGAGLGPASPLAAEVKSIGGIAVAALGVRAALPLVFRSLGMAGIHFGSVLVYDGIRGLSTLAAVVAYLFWFSKFYNWVRQARGGTAYSTGYAIGAWFIPFVNFVVPYRALKDGATKTFGVPVPMVDLWWGAYLTVMFINIFFAAFDAGLEVGSAGLLNALSWLLTASQVVAYGVWAKLVSELTARTR